MSQSTRPPTITTHPNKYAQAALDMVAAVNEQAVAPDVEGFQDRLRDCFTSDGMIELAPSSFHAMDGTSGAQTVAQRLELGKQMKGVFKTMNIRPFDIVVSEATEGEAPRVVVQAKADGQAHNGTPYTMDYVDFYWFEKDSESKGGKPKITYFKEVIDTKYLDQFMAAAVPQQ